MARPKQEKEMTFIEHLDELRTRLIICIVAVCVCSVAGWFVGPIGLDYIISKVHKVQYLSPADPIIIKLKLAGVAGLIIAAPIIIYEIWMFIAPGLYKHERRFAAPTIFSAIILFFAGAAVGVYSLPITIGVLEKFGSANMTPNYTIDRFIKFAGSFILGFAIVFEIPVVIVLLAKIGIVNYSMLAKNRSYAYVIILIIAAVVTPADVVSMIIMAVPLLVLFEMSLFVVRFFIKPVKRGEENSQEE
jgi:sec-independent protein translocase protein TatC